MTEQEWLECADPTPMLGFLNSLNTSERKLLLFKSACLRQYHNQFTEKRTHLALDSIERTADGESTHLIGVPGAELPLVSQLHHRPEKRGEQCRLLHCVFGNPFRPVCLDPSWLSSTVLSLARAAYEERALPSGQLDSERLSILADGLEDAGCSAMELLTHLRGPGPHTRGCWAVDVLLGKE